MEASDLPPSVFLGYRVKVPWMPDATWDLNQAGVVEVCSVSDCISKRPSEWMQHWTHNRAWSYSIAETAVATIPTEGRDKYELFAYWALLRTFIDGAWKDLSADDMFGADLPPLPGGPGPTDYEVLGFDVVCWEQGTT